MIISISFSNLKQHLDYIEKEIIVTNKIEELLTQIRLSDSINSGVINAQLQCIQNEKYILVKRRELLENIYFDFKDATLELNDRLLDMKKQINKG